MCVSLCVCLPITFYPLHPFNHADNPCHIHIRNGLKSYKWRPIRLTHMIYHHPSLSYWECKYNLPPRQPLEPRAATLYLSPGWERPSRASSVWKLKSPHPTPLFLLAMPGFLIRYGRWEIQIPFTPILPSHCDGRRFHGDVGRDMVESQEPL